MESEEESDRHERRGLWVIAFILLVAMAVVGFMVWRLYRVAQPVSANEVAPYTDCVGWITRTDMAMFLTPELMTGENVELGALVLCRYTIAKEAKVRFTKDGKQAELPMEIDTTEGQIALMAKATIPPMPRGYYTVEFVLDGEAIDRTWLEVQAPEKPGPGPR